jgi:hypothetical protein
MKEPDGFYPVPVSMNMNQKQLNIYRLQPAFLRLAFSRLQPVASFLPEELVLFFFKSFPAA